MGRRAALLMLIAALLAGCANSAPVASDAVGRAPDHRSAEPPARSAGPVRAVGPCLTGEPTRATRAQLRAFRPVVAMRCIDVERTYPDGEWTVRVQQVSGDGVDRFAASLDRADAEATSGACASVLVMEPDVVLVDAAGHRLVPRFPRDECGQPAASLTDALRHWRAVGTPVRVHQQYSRAELDHHCEPAWKDMFRVDDQFGGFPPDPGGPVFTRGDQHILDVCIYRTGADPIAGAFERGFTLRGRDAATLLTALSGAGTGAACTAADEFATVAERGGALVTVELAGCGRVERTRDDPVHQVSHSTFGSADLAAVRRLLGS